MEGILRRLWKWWREPGPHFTVVEEIARVTSPDGRRDAVLESAGGRNVKLHVVSRGKSICGHYVAALIHCEDPDALRISWSDPSHVDVEGRWDEIGHSGIENFVTKLSDRYRFRV